MEIRRIEEQEVNDILEKESIDLSSFQIRETLNPSIFDDTQHMYEDVRTRLLMIADDFFETLNVGWVDIDDIILTGSLANYNWSQFSDVDVHILVDYEEVDDNVRSLHRSYPICTPFHSSILVDLSMACSAPALADTAIVASATVGDTECSAP